MMIRQGIFINDFIIDFIFPGQLIFSVIFLIRSVWLILYGLNN
jgi:hypothetical protein